MSHESRGPTDTNLQQRLYEVCKAAFDEGLARAESYDRKAQIVFGISGALLAFMLGRLNDTLSAIRTAGVLGWSIVVIYILADVALAAALILGIAAVMPRTYKSYPEPSEVLRKFSSKDVREIDLLASVAKYFAENTDKNERSNHRRSVYLKLSVGALVVGVVLVLAFIAISAVSAASSPSVQREATSNGTRGLTAGNQEDSGHEEVHEATTESRTP